MYVVFVIGRLSIRLYISTHKRMTRAFRGNCQDTVSVLRRIAGVAPRPHVWGRDIGRECYDQICEWPL